MNFLLEVLYGAPFRRGFVRWSAGAAACLVFYWSFAAAAMSHHEAPSVAVVLAIEVALVAMVATGIGRHFAAGFVGVIAMFAIPTKGAMLVLPWGMPMIAAYQRVSHYHPHHAPPTLTRKTWVEARRAAPPDLAQAQILTNAVNECARQYRGNDLQESYPRRADDETFTSCGNLSSTRSGLSISKFNPTDNGWRWSYTPGAPDSAGRITYYSVRVFEDPAIGRVSPQYASDTTGAIQQLVSGKAPVFVATPIESLQLIHECIAKVPELRKADNEVARNYTYYKTPLDEIVRRCSSLRGHLTVTDPFATYGILAVTAPDGMNAAETVATFGIELVPVDQKQFIFEIMATSRSALPNYRVDRDGGIHVRTGEIVVVPEVQAKS